MSSTYWRRPQPDTNEIGTDERLLSVPRRKKGRDIPTIKRVIGPDAWRKRKEPQAFTHAQRVCQWLDR